MKSLKPDSKQSFRLRVYAWLRSYGAYVGSGTYDIAIDTVFNTPLLISIVEPGFIALRFLNAAVKVTREIRNVHLFNPVSGKWNIQFTLGSGNERVNRQRNIFRSKEDDDRLNEAAFAELKLRLQDVCQMKRIIRDR